MHGDDQVDSDESLVRELLADQFPEWTALPITRLQTDGTDNAIYRLGDDLVVRLMFTRAGQTFATTSVADV